jgi:heme/copper-type cytochrome/quinol oxidase subunit 3
VIAVEPATRRGHGTAWWGMVCMIATESMIFAILIASYFFLRASARDWPPPGVEAPDLTLAIPFSLVLWGSSLPAFWAEHGIRRGDQRRLRSGLLLSSLMGLAFVAYTVKDFHDLHFGWRDNAYGSIFYVTVGLHATHVVVGLLMSVIVQIKSWQGKFSAGRHVTVEVFSLYWHFVDAVWLFVFPALFLSPHIR